jgi:hypothetical protein
MDLKQAIEVMDKIEKTFLNTHHPLEYIMYTSKNNAFGRSYTVGEMYKMALSIIKHEIKERL